MDRRERVARAMRDADVRYKAGDDPWLGRADAAIAAMEPDARPADDEARWVVEQAVRLMAVPGVGVGRGQGMSFSLACDAVRAELLRLRQDGEGV